MVGVAGVFLHYFYQIQIACRIQSALSIGPSQSFQGLITSYVVHSFTLEVKRISFESKTAFETFSAIA